MNYILYKTTNVITGKFYIGIHKQKEGLSPLVFDGYLGSGKILKQSIDKYGKESFVRETMYVFNTLEEAQKKESEIVNKFFVENVNTYNVAVGGGIPPSDPSRWKGRKHKKETLQKISINRKNKGSGENHWTKNPSNLSSLLKMKNINSEKAKIRNKTLKPALGHIVSDELKQRFSEMNKKLRWYKNLNTNTCIFSRECPDGYVPGRIFNK